MRKVVIHAPGGFDELRVETHPDPEPGPGQVRIATEAIGINYADSIVRMGLYSSAKTYVGWPITPGFEVAGRIDRVGPGVEGLTEGDEVIGMTRFSGYSTHVVLPQHLVFHRPHTLSVEQAAAFPAVFMTAWYALRELAHPRPGYTLLVHSAAGGVGSALTQVGKLLGCRVVGVVGASHKVESVLHNGADAVIDKSREDLWQEAGSLAKGGYDVVLDANGVETLKDGYEHLRPGGRLVVYGFHSMLPRGSGRVRWAKLAFDWLRTPRFNPIDLTDRNRSVMAFNVSYLFDRRDLISAAMAELLGWLSEGKLTPPAVTTYPLERVADAQRAIESAQTIGKLVLIP